MHVESPSLLEATLTLVERLVALTPAPESIWLIGSRANGRAHSESDTDLLVFGTSAFLLAARSAVGDDRTVDVLVVHDGDNFLEVRGGKSGSLRKWGWAMLTPQEATYTGAKFIPDELDDDDCVHHLALDQQDLALGTPVDYHERAVRLWPRDA